MDSFLEQFINGIYQEAQQVLSYFFGYPPHRCTIIKFGGFHLSYDWYGRTRLGKEEIGNLVIYTKEIHLNILFAYCLGGLKSDIPNFTELFGFRKLVNTIAHELAHCLMANYKLQFGYKHGGLTQDIEAFCWTLPEIKELERLQGFQWKELAKNLR